MSADTLTETSGKLIESQLLDAARHLHAAEAAYTAALDLLEDREEIATITAIHNLRVKTIGLTRATERERLLTKHAGTAPKTAAISRGIS